MRPASAGHSILAEEQKSRLQIKVGNRGLFRRTEPRNADTQMEGFLDNGTIPVLSFKASPHKIEAALTRPLQAVRTELMDLATAILDRVVGEWSCMEELVGETRGEKISRPQAEEFFEGYLRYHNVPGKLQIRWVQKLNSGGKLQEYGRRDKPTSRRLRLWISSGFGGVQFSRSMTAFADHEICTHAVRALNDHAQVWVNHRARYGLSSGSRDCLGTEEGLAALNSLLCYRSSTRHLWSAAMLYYCAVKGQDMGFGELHKHLVKYVRCPAKRYWYCVRTKGKRASLDQPGSCGKGQVYLEGAVDILQAVDGIDFHLLYSGKVPLSKLGRVKNIARSSLVTLPKFVRDQRKYKSILRQIGRLNGILPEHSRLSAEPNLGIRIRAKKMPRKKRLTRRAAGPEKKEDNVIRPRETVIPGLSTSMPGPFLPQRSPPHAKDVGDGSEPAEDLSCSSSSQCHPAGPGMRRVCGEVTTTRSKAPSHQQPPKKGTGNHGDETAVEKATIANADHAVASTEPGEQRCEHPALAVPEDGAVQARTTQGRHNQCIRRNSNETNPIILRTLPPSLARKRGRLRLRGRSHLEKSADSSLELASKHFLA